jgi:predicted dehydrogenase
LLLKPIDNVPASVIQEVSRAWGGQTRHGWRRTRLRYWRHAPDRLKSGQTEGFLEAFANVYLDVAELIEAHARQRPPDPLATTLPTAWDGLLGMRFIEAAVGSHLNQASWTILSP